LFDGSRELSEIIEEVARLGARLIIQTALEAEVDVFHAWGGLRKYQRKDSTVRTLHALRK
jgi:hypothetical protein